MNRYVLLCGSAPHGQIQKRLDEMYDSLTTEGVCTEDEIMVFPNGVTEEVLSYFLNNLRMSGIEQILLYICTLSPVEACEKTASLSGFVLSGGDAECAGNGFNQNTRDNSAHSWA